MKRKQKPKARRQPRRDTPEARYIDKQQARVVREQKSVAVDRQIRVISDKHGAVTAGLLLAEARDKRNPLHEYFEWDDTVAGEKYRLSQAQEMIRASKFVLVIKASSESAVDASLVESAPERTVQVRKFLPLARGAGQKTRQEVLADEEARARRVETMVGRLRGWCIEVLDLGELDYLRVPLERLLRQEQALAAE